MKMSNVDFLIRKKLLRYHINKNKQLYIGELSEKEAKQVMYIEATLKCFNPVDLEFIYNVYIFDQKPIDTNKSRSSYYYNKKRLNALLYEILEDLD